MEYWKRCNLCKKELGFKAIYYICNVTTCTRKRTGMVFCSVSCWDGHVPVLRHKESWSIEMRSPTREVWQAVLDGKCEDETFGKAKKQVQAPEPEAKTNPFAGTRKAILRKPAPTEPES